MTSNKSKTVSFKPRPVDEGVLPPEPVESRSYLNDCFEQNVGSPSKLFDPVIENSVQNADASKIGWVLHYPTNAVLSPVISESTGNDAEWITGVNSEEQIIRVDTRWSVSIPEGTALIAYSPFNHVQPDGVSILPTMVENNTGMEHTGCMDSCRDCFTEIRIPMVISQEARVSTSDICTQLVLVDDIAEHIASRALTSDEQQTVEKFYRAMDIYPDWYAENRDSHW